MKSRPGNKKYIRYSYILALSIDLKGSKCFSNWKCDNDMRHAPKLHKLPYSSQQTYKNCRTHLQGSLFPAQFAGVRIQLSGDALEAVANIACGVSYSLGQAGCLAFRQVMSFLLILMGLWIFLYILAQVRILSISLVPINFEFTTISSSPFAWGSGTAQCLLFQHVR